MLSKFEYSAGFRFKENRQWNKEKDAFQVARLLIRLTFSFRDWDICRSLLTMHHLQKPGGTEHKEGFLFQIFIALCFSSTVYLYVLLFRPGFH